MPRDPAFASALPKHSSRRVIDSVQMLDSEVNVSTLFRSREPLPLVRAKNGVAGARLGRRLV